MKNTLRLPHWQCRWCLFLLLFGPAYMSSAYAQCCPPDTDVLEITQDAYRIDSAMTAADVQVFNIDSGCLPYADTFPESSEARYHHLIPLQVSADDVIAIYSSEDGIGTSLFFSLYQGSYDANDPCQNLVGASNLAPSQGNDIRLASLLKSETTYQLLITTLQPNVTGEYTIRIATAADSTIVMTTDGSLATAIDPDTDLGPLPKDSATYTLPLYCSDDSYLLNNVAALFGSPLEQPGCENIQNVSEQIEQIPNGDCGAPRIRRTISFDGLNGAPTQCTQRIFMKQIETKPQKEIWLPPSNIRIRDDQVTSVLSNGYPSPEVTGVPFMWTIQGVYSLEDEVCNVGAAIHDESAPAGDCEDSYSFTRSWIILNWCTPQDYYIFNQHIEVHTTLPEINCGQLSSVLTPLDSDGDGAVDTANIIIYASDVITTPAISCSDSIHFSINRSGEAPVPEQTSLTLGCEDVGIVNIEIWAYDSLGNTNSCETFIVVEDGLDVCAADPHLMAGSIVTEDEEGVANVLVELSTSSVTDTVYTSASGSYAFPPGFEADSTLTIKPEKDYDHLNGVSTFDMVLISKHILGVTPLSSPYQMIAADVNNSGSITTLDLIQIRKLILQVISEFPNNTSWRFINASFALDDPSNPWSGWDTTETTQSPYLEDFIGIKVGDIDGSADPSSLQQNSDVMVRDGTPFYLHTSARQLQASQSYDLPIFANQMRDIDGFQATLQAHPAVELLGVEGGLMNADHFGPVQPDGAMAMSWVAPQELPEGKQPLFTLRVKAKAALALEEAVRINATLLQSEAYGKDGRRRPVALRFDAPAAIPDVPQLRNNYPNPFRESTQVDFYLPADSPARLSVHNAIGQLLFTVELAGHAGWNTVQLGRRLPDAAAGLLQYTLEVGEHRLTKRMVKLYKWRLSLNFSGKCFRGDRNTTTGSRSFRESICLKAQKLSEHQ